MREKWRTWGVAALSFVAAVAAPGGERDPRTRLHEVLDQRREAFAQVAREIWGFAEVGYQEEKSSALPCPSARRWWRAPRATAAATISSAPPPSPPPSP